MEEINYCRTCHSSQQNSLIDIFQNNYDKLYNDLTQFPISEDDMYSKFICSTCIKELNHWEDFKTKCMNSLEDYFKDVISVKQKIEIKQELSEEPLIESEIMLHSILDIKEEVQEPAYETYNPYPKSQNRENEYQIFIQENPIEKIGKLFYCNYSNCNKTFHKAKRYEIHLRAHFNLKSDDDQFIIEAQKSKNFKCSRINCHYKTNCSTNLDIHLRKKHDALKDKLKCKYCPQTFKKFSKKQLHEESHIGEKNEKYVLSCDLCGDTFLRKINLKIHTWQAHLKRTKSFTCDLCPKAYWTSKYLEDHKQTEHSSVICRICKIKCLSRSELITHRAEEHGINSEQYICDICGKNLANPTSLKRHKATHNKIKMFKCKICEFTTNTEINLEKHLRNIHPASRPYACDICEKSFARKSTLNIHKKNHQDRNLECPICGKSFKTEAALWGHKTTHNLHRPFICDVCKMGFKSKDGLKQHAQTHKKEREPVQCDICGRSYISKRSLSSHKATSHRTNRQTDTIYNCDMCDKKFASKRNLKRHMRKHCGSRDQICTVCGAAFKYPSSVVNHMKKHKKKEETAT